jgi:hypothetical protein
MRAFLLLCGLAMAGPLCAEITSRASVTVSDGLLYRVTTVYRDQHHALFHRIYPERVVTQVVDGDAVWQRLGSERTPGNAFVELLVLGHQFHAQLLWPDQFFVDSETEASIDPDCQCQISVATDRFGNVVRLRQALESGLTTGNITQIKDGPRIDYQFSDWREVSGRQLPFTILIDDGERRFEYRFEEVRLEADAAWGDLVTQ